MSKYLITALVFVSMAASTLALNLKIATVSAPAINCIFNSNCKVTATDLATHFTIYGASGTGFLQSRNFRGEPGTPAAGFTAYLYRIDLTGITNVTTTNDGVAAVTVDFHHLVRGLDYNGDTNKDDVFVITKGGLGSVGPKIAFLNPPGNKIRFTFDPPIHYGQTSYFFGVCSSNAPTIATSQVLALDPLVPPTPQILYLTNSSPKL